MLAMADHKKLLGQRHFGLTKLISPFVKPSGSHSPFLEASIRSIAGPVSTGLVLFLLLCNFSFGQLLKIQQLVFKKVSYDISKFGAKADGITLNTKAITAAINDCHEKGGGEVIIPKGLW